MFVFENDPGELRSWARREVEFERPLEDGSRGSAVKRTQEWLNLHGFGLLIDGIFGPVTRRAVERFQVEKAMAPTGKVDPTTHAVLVRPMLETLRRRPLAGATLRDAILEYARAHLDQHPREIGGQNRGPWVRLYMEGNDGAPWAWCAGFVTYVLKQAAESVGASVPIRGSGSCDTLAAQARAEDLFLAERDVVPGALPPGSIFLVRRTSTDWTHCGWVTDALVQAFDTIEGNTNDDGNPEGYEVCSRSRGYGDKDFIVLS